MLGFMKRKSDTMPSTRDQRGSSTMRELSPEEQKAVSGGEIGIPMKKQKNPG